MWFDPQQANCEPVRHAFPSRNTGLACVLYSYIIVAYPASILHFCLPRRTPHLFRLLRSTCNLYGSVCMTTPLQGWVWVVLQLRSSSPCQGLLWEWSCDSVCAKDAQRAVSWCIWESSFLGLVGEVPSEFYCQSLRNPKAIQVPACGRSSHKESQTPGNLWDMGPEPRDSSILKPVQTWYLQLHESCITLYFCLFQLRFSVIHR